MTLRKWQLKRIWMMPFMQSQSGADLYEWLTAAVIGTQGGMSRKWCYWFREHIVLCRRFGDVTFKDKRIWLFQPGWSLAPILLSRMATGNGPLITEDRRRLARRYVPMAIEEVKKVAHQLCISAKADRSAAELLDQVRYARTPNQILNICGAQYTVTQAAQLENLPVTSMDVCMSMGRLEHFSAADLEALFKQMHRMLSPGAIGSHIVDHRDHFWHYDKSIHCFHHLTFTEEQWSALSKGRKAYRNQLLEKDYIGLFERCGFEVLACIHELHRRDAEGVDPRKLWGHFAELSPEELQAAVSHFIVRRS